MYSKLKKSLIGLLLALSVSTASAFTEGVEYTRLPVPLTTTATEGKVEVVEIFWYLCPHCFSLEANLDSWQVPENIDFKLVPAISPKGWAALGARTFYTAVALGVLDKIHTPLFEAIHLEKKSELGNDTVAIAEFFGQYGVSSDSFYETWNSFFVESKLSSATQTFVNTGITGVPSVIINGKYVTSPSKAGGAENMIRLIEHLAHLESTEK